jgi:hypothetical protein
MGPLREIPRPKRAPAAVLTWETEHDTGLPHSFYLLPRRQTCVKSTQQSLLAPDSGGQTGEMTPGAAVRQQSSVKEGSQIAWLGEVAGGRNAQATVDRWEWLSSIA